MRRDAAGVSWLGLAFDAALPQVVLLPVPDLTLTLTPFTLTLALTLALTLTLTLTLNREGSCRAQRATAPAVAGAAAARRARTSARVGARTGRSTSTGARGVTRTPSICTRGSGCRQTSCSRSPCRSRTEG